MKEKFMKEALKEAKKAYNKLEVPVGANYCKKNGKNYKTKRHIIKKEK